MALYITEAMGKMGCINKMYCVLTMSPSSDFKALCFNLNI